MYTVDQAIVVLAKFCDRMLTRDLFAVAHLLVYYVLLCCTVALICV